MKCTDAEREDSSSLTKSYLKYSRVQQPSPEHSDTLCADFSIVPSQQIHGLYPLTVQEEGHELALHAVSYPVPSERTEGKNKQVVASHLQVNKSKGAFKSET